MGSSQELQDQLQLFIKHPTNARCCVKLSTLYHLFRFNFSDDGNEIRIASKLIQLHSSAKRQCWGILSPGTALPVTLNVATTERSSGPRDCNYEQSHLHSTEKGLWALMWGTPSPWHSLMPKYPNRLGVLYHWKRSPCCILPRSPWSTEVKITVTCMRSKTRAPSIGSSSPHSSSLLLTPTPSHPGLLCIAPLGSAPLHWYPPPSNGSPI